jgi:DNA polymerase III delta prime subunit
MTAPDVLLQTARRGELHHTLILHGSDSRLLRATSLAIARALTCLEGTTGDGCPSCSKIDRGIHPDVTVLEVGEQRKLISVEQIRSVISEAALRPYEARRRVFIIDPADAVSAGGLNALLKTLEEPSASSMFLLLTRSPDRLLPTIRSRAQLIAIRPQVTPPGEVAAREQIPLQLARLRQSAGDLEPGEAEVLAREIVAQLASFAARRDYSALLSVAARCASLDSPVDAVSILAAILRDLAALDPEETIAPSEARTIREGLGARRLLETAEEVLKGGNRLLVNVDLRLAIEQALLTLRAR